MIVFAGEEAPKLPLCSNCMNPTDPAEYMALDHYCQRCESDFLRNVMGLTEEYDGEE